MKRVLSIAFVLLCIVSLLPFSANAQEFDDWDQSDGKTTLKFETSGQGYTFIYDPTVHGSGEIAFELPTNGGVFISVYLKHETETFGPQIPMTQIVDNDKIYFIVDLKETSSYIIYFSAFDVPFTCETRSFKWEASMYKTVTAGQTHTLTLSPESSMTYIASVPTSGLYTLSLGHEELHGNMSRYPIFYGDDEYPDAVSLGYWQDNGKYQYCYYLESGVKYSLDIYYYGEADLTANFTLKQGDLSGDRAIWKDGEPISLTIEPHENENMKYKTLVFQAKHDGKHCLFSNTFYGDLRNAWGQPPEGGQTFQDANLDQGWVYELKKDEYYVITVHNYTDTTKTDTITLTHYTNYKSGELKILEHSDSRITIGLFTDPACAALDGVKWSCSDLGIFDLEENGVPLLYLYPKKQGSAEITAKVGSLTKTITVSTTYTPPALREGKTEYIAKSSPSDPCAYFTPSVSGTYKLNVSPYYAGDGYRYSIAIIDPNGERIFSDYGFENWPDIEVELKAGVKYTVCVDGSPSELRFDLKSTAVPPTDPTEPEETKPKEEPTEPSTGATEPTETKPKEEPTEPSSGATEPAETKPKEEPTEPSTGATEPAETKPKEDPTEPSTGATEPSDPKNETKPSGSHGNEESKPGQNDPLIPMEDVVIRDEGAYITGDAMEQIIQKLPGHELVLDLSKEQNVTNVHIDTDALDAAVQDNRALSVQFDNDLQLHLSHDILNNLVKENDNTNIVLTAQIVSLKELSEQQQSALQEMNVASVVNVDLTCDGKAIHMLGGKAKITIPVPESDAPWQVYYVSDDGKLEEMAVDSVKDGHIVVYTDHFSSFVLVKVPQAQVGSNNNGWIIPAIVVVMVAGGAAAVLILKKKGLLPSLVKK